jgi:YfiH family protein
MVELLRAAGLGDVLHGFAGRRGGVSAGIHAGLNVGLGSEDEREAVLRNRDLARDALLPGATLVTVHQVHSPDALYADAPWPDDARPKADAIVTDRPGLALGILTADCTPVLLADREAGVIGAAHAGWRGAQGGVLENAVAAMEQLGAERSRIVAAIGPAIGQASYEVDDRFRDSFAETDERFFAPGRPGHWQFDLSGYAAARLHAAGVRTVDALGLDTYPDDTRFFSYRRATHRDEPNYGRQFSLIGLPGTASS